MDRKERLIFVFLQLLTGRPLTVSDIISRIYTTFGVLIKCQTIYSDLAAIEAQVILEVGKNREGHPTYRIVTEPLLAHNSTARLFK